LEGRTVPSNLIDFGRLPPAFEANVGQTDAQVRFLSRGPGAALFLTDTEAVLSLRRTASADGQGAVLRLGLVGGQAVAPAARLGLQEGRSNYFVGSDPARWHADVPRYDQVAYRQVYAGIDLVFHGGSQRQLEYDFVVAPGADPGPIAVRFTGATGLELTAPRYL